MDWRKIEEYNYSINENGEVRNDKTGKIKKPGVNTGYLTVVLYKNCVHKNFKIHRLLAKYFLPDYSENLCVDHIDRDPLNNNLENLRMITQQQNVCNRTKSKNCSSKYKGVSFDKNSNKWACYFQIDSKKKHIGLFNTELEAGQAYNKYLEDNNLIYYPKNDI